MESKLKYSDETDKSLGIAGMAISLVACDCEDKLSSVSLEPGEESIEMAGEFFFSGNPRFSAKIAWNEIIRQFHIVSCMLLGNVMCRHLSTGKNVDNAILKIVHDIILDEGVNSCSLEEDEVENLYNKEYRYYSQLFSHPTVALVAKDFATTLRMQRRMTSGEVIENLRRLSNI